MHGRSQQQQVISCGALRGAVHGRACGGTLFPPLPMELDEKSTEALVFESFDVRRETLQWTALNAIRFGIVNRAFGKIELRSQKREILINKVSWFYTLTLTEKSIATWKCSILDRII